MGCEKVGGIFLNKGGTTNVIVSQRDSVAQPKVARHGLHWVNAKAKPNRNGIVPASS